MRRRWRATLGSICKWVLGLAVLGAGLLLLVGGVVLFSASARAGKIDSRAVGAFAILLLVALASGWAGRKILSHPISRTGRGGQSWFMGEFLDFENGREAATSNAGEPEGVQTIIGLSQELCDEWGKANELLERNQAEEAEKHYDSIMASADQIDSATYALLLHGKVSSAILRGHLQRAREMIDSFLTGANSMAEKIRFLDRLASMLLYREPPEQLEFAEEVIRKGISLAPAVVTLKGTLGGALAERGQFVEAKAYLEECLKGSSELHDQGISLFYLAKVAHGVGNDKQARRLAADGIALYSADWLRVKCEKLMKELGASEQ